MIACEICGIATEDLDRYNYHVRLHRDEKSATFVCKVDDCLKQFSNFVQFARHVKRNHYNEKPFIKTNYVNLLNGEIVTCCDITFKSYNSYKSHVYRKHQKNTDNNLNIAPELPGCSEPFEDENVSHSSVNESLVVNDSIPIPNLKSTFENQCGILFLTLLGRHNVTNSALQTIIHFLIEITKANNSRILNSLLETFSGDFESKISKILENDLMSTNLELFKTDFLRKKYFHKYFDLVGFNTITLGRNNENKISKYYYVSILDTIPNFLKKSSLLQKQQFDGFLTDYQDARLFQKSQFFNSGDTKLEIILYQDAFNVCNPLGQYKNSKKFVGVYMSIGNIPSYNRSNIDNIQLVLLCHEKDVKFFGFSKVLEILMSDIKVLEEKGIVVDFQESSICMKGSIFAVTGDNLESHQIACLNENFSTSEYFCRYCYITNNSFHSDYSKRHQLRTKQSYDIDLANVATENISLSRGLKGKTVLNTSSIYHTSNPGLPPCIAHDLFEGIVNYDLFLIFQRMIKDNWFQLNFLNAVIKKWFKKFKINDSLELKIKSSKKINCKAAFCWNLIQVLPVVLLDTSKDKIDSPLYKMCMVLKEMVDLITAQAISESQIAYLSVVISEYLHLRVSSFCSIRLRPKHHFITHYPYLIRQFGPLIRFWTMRFESKHSFFKNIIRHTRNFKNVEKTCTERHQYLQSLISVSSSRFHKTIVLEYLEDNSPEVIFSDEDKVAFVKYNINHKSFFQCKKIKFRGKIFKIGSVIFFKRDANSEVIFCIIKTIFVNKTTMEPFFMFYEKKAYENREIGLYEIYNDIVSKINYIKVSDLIDVTVDNKFQGENEVEYVCVKHAIPF